MLTWVDDSLIMCSNTYPSLSLSLPAYVTQKQHKLASITDSIKNYQQCPKGPAGSGRATIIGHRVNSSNIKVGVFVHMKP